MSTRNTVHFTTRSSELAAAASTAFTFSRAWCVRSEEHTSELQSRSDLVCRLLLEKKKKKNHLSIEAIDHTLEPDSGYKPLLPLLVLNVKNTLLTHYRVRALPRDRLRSPCGVVRGS